MILDENTTIFLIQVLNEADEMGGGVSLTPYEQTVYVVDPKTGKSKKVKNKQKEDKFYKGVTTSSKGLPSGGTTT